MEHRYILAIIFSLFMIYTITAVRINKDSSGEITIRHARADAQNSAALSFASALCDIGIVKILLEKGATPDTTLALPNAANCGNPELIRLLIQNGARKHLDEALVSAAGGMPIANPKLNSWEHQEDDKKRAEIVSTLITLGARVNAHNSAALIDASKVGRNEVIRILLANGDRGDARDSQALIEAIRNGHHVAAHTLLTFET